MIYMVEMALLDTARRAEWEAWYVEHQHRLLSIPGFRASQRFESIRPAPAPFVALHEVDSAEVFASPAYRAKAGPSNTGEWQARMGNWHRNLFDGLDHTPDVSTDQRLLVMEEGAETGSPISLDDVGVEWVRAVGLDRSVPRRGLGVKSIGFAEGLADIPGIRVLTPLGPRLRSAS